jgi:pimeloyl-ACP methyl ester carboxylesterase
MLTGAFFPVQIAPSAVSERATSHTVNVGGNNVFYREAGRPSSPTLVLLHGNPSSSFMFRDLIPRLANHFHVIAPDYPGFGYSDTPAPETYAYTFDHLTQTIDQFLTQIGAASYILYMQDYGGPVGMRLATAHPDRVKGLIIQNANAYNEGLPPEWRTELEQQARSAAYHPHAPTPSRHRPPSAFEANLKWTRQMYVRGAHEPSTISPDGYTLDAALLSRPGQDDIQEILGDDYYTNMLLYPTWQQWLRLHQPRTLIVWGRGDYIFGPIAAESYKRDLPQAKLVFYDGGHFALEEYAPEVAHEIIEMFAPGSRPTATPEISKYQPAPAPHKRR